MEEIGSGGSRLDVDAEAVAEELLQGQTQLLRMLQFRGAVGGDQEEGFKRLFVEIGGLVLDQFNGHDSLRPDVDLGAVFLLLDHFRRHPIGSPDHGCALGFVVGEFGAETEVG